MRKQRVAAASSEREAVKQSVGWLCARTLLWSVVCVHGCPAIVQASVPCRGWGCWGKRQRAAQRSPSLRGCARTPLGRCRTAALPGTQRRSLRRFTGLLGGLMVVGGHKRHLGDGRVVQPAAHAELQLGARLGVRFVDVPARWVRSAEVTQQGTVEGGGEQGQCWGGGGAGGMEMAAVQRSSEPGKTAGERARQPAAAQASGSASVFEGRGGGAERRAHPMAMFFLRQGLKAPLVISPTRLPSAVSIWKHGSRAGQPGHMQGG